MLLPHTLETHSWVDLYGLYESDHLSASTRSLSWDDTFFKEMLSLQTSGYFYHPRLLQYRLLLSGALKQETFEQSFLTPQGTQHGQAFEYDARAYFLPEHPYNLELFTSRYEPLFRQQYVTGLDSVSTSSGADFRYRARPWSIHARAEEDTFEPGGVKTTVRLLDLDGRYSRDYSDGRRLSFGFTYLPSRLTDTVGNATDTTNASFTNTLKSRLVGLDSNLNVIDIDQRGGPTTIPVTTRMIAWNEQFSADIAKDLHSDLFWRYLDNRSDYVAAPNATTVTTTAVSSIQRGAEADLRYQLYQSLQTSVALRWDSNTATGGETTVVNGTLNFAYTKRVPGAHGWLNLGLYVGKGETRNEGQAQVVDEQHPSVRVPGTFPLGQSNVDPATVAILVRATQAPFDLVRLTEGIHYTVATVGNTLEVTILTLPAEFLVPGSYDFRATYSLNAGVFTVRTRTFGQNGSLALFNNLLTPYYSYTEVRSDTISGEVPGGGIDSRVITAGLSFFDGPFRARLEYGDVQWAISPWHGWRGELQYTGPLGPTTNVNAAASYQIRNVEESPEGDGPPPYTEKTFSASGNVQQYLLSRTLAVSGGGTFNWLTGLSESRSYSLNATLTWKIGKLDISGGATYSDTDTQNGTAYASRTVHRFYFLRLRRLLF